MEDADSVTGGQRQRVNCQNSPILSLLCHTKILILSYVIFWISGVKFMIHFYKRRFCAFSWTLSYNRAAVYLGLDVQAGSYSGIILLVTLLQGDFA